MNVGNVLTVQRDLSDGRRFQAGNRPQKRRFSAAGRTNENDKLLFLNREIDLL